MALSEAQQQGAGLDIVTGFVLHQPDTVLVVLEGLATGSLPR